MGDALRRPEGRCAATTVLTAVTSGLSVVREPRQVRERFEHQLRNLVRARSVTFRDDREEQASGPHAVTVQVSGPPGGRARLEALFDPARPPDMWTRRMLCAAGQVAGLLLEIERANGRWPLACASSRVDGAAPLIGSSQAIRTVRDRVEKSRPRISRSSSKELRPTAAPGCCWGFGEVSVDDGEWEMAGGEAARILACRPTRWPVAPATLMMTTAVLLGNCAQKASEVEGYEICLSPLHVAARNRLVRRSGTLRRSLVFC